MTIDGVMEFLFVHRASALPPSALAEVFDRLIWCTDDQGAGLLKVREEWLRSTDRARVEIALAMEESLPFANFAEMDEALTCIETLWPDLGPRCCEIRAGRHRVESR